jgi:hypothetical protein
VVVNDFVDRDAVHGTPVEAAVALERRRVVGRAEDQAEWVVEVDCEPPLVIASELMAPAWQLAHVLKSVDGCKLLQSEGDLGRADIAPSPLQAAVIGEQALELVGGEQDFHGVIGGTSEDRTLPAYGETGEAAWMRYVVISARYKVYLNGEGKC